MTHLPGPTGRAWPAKWSSLALAPRRALLLSLATFGLACVLPALAWRNASTGEPAGTWFGGYILSIGYFGILNGQFAWFANIPLALGWITLAASGRANLATTTFACAIIALILSSFTLSTFFVPTPLGDDPTRHLATPLPGAFAWWASILLLLLGARAAQRLPAGDSRAEGKITDRPGDDFDSWVARRNLQNNPHVPESAPPPPNNP